MTEDDLFVIAGEDAVVDLLRSAFDAARGQLKALRFNDSEVERELRTLIAEAGPEDEEIEDDEESGEDEDEGEFSYVDPYGNAVPVNRPNIGWNGR